MRESECEGGGRREIQSECEGEGGRVRDREGVRKSERGGEKIDRGIILPIYSIYFSLLYFR